VKSDLEWSQETIKDLESALEAKEEELAKAVEVRTRYDTYIHACIGT
jgi:hypothetical protein